MKTINTQRGMKKWQPFNALEQFSEYINKTYSEHNKIEKPLLSDEQIEDLNEKLSSYNHDLVFITHFNNGYINKIQGIITKIDIQNQTLTIDKTRIHLSNLLKLEFCN